MRNTGTITNPMKFSMADYDALPRTKRQVLANAPKSFGIQRNRAFSITVEALERNINQKMNEATLRDYGPDHPDLGRNYYPKIVRGINLDKLEGISL